MPSFLVCPISTRSAIQASRPSCLLLNLIWGRSCDGRGQKEARQRCRIERRSHACTCDVSWQLKVDTTKPVDDFSDRRWTRTRRYSDLCSAAILKTSASLYLSEVRERGLRGLHSAPKDHWNGRCQNSPKARAILAKTRQPSSKPECSTCLNGTGINVSYTRLQLALRYLYEM